MKKTIISIFLALLVYSNTNAQFAELVAKTEKAIFQISCYDEYGAPSSTGTGFFINSDGTGLTNVHVLEDAKYAFIQDIKGNFYQIDQVTRICEACDIAEFKVITNGNIFASLNITNTMPLKGSDVFVIGNPEGLKSTVSKGIVSAIREEGYKVQITAPISHGSSGSPIMDMSGNVFAIANSGNAEGQNLNFGYWMGCREKLVINTKFKLSNNQTNNLFIINKMCEGESGLILNSIEVNEKNTVLNFTYTNTAMAYGDNAYIFTKIGDVNESFYIEDKLTKKRFYIYDATIGNSPKSPTFLALGETKRFKMYFPPLDGVNEINILEGMLGSDWSFTDISLSDYKSFSFTDENYFKDFYYHIALSCLSKKEYLNAYKMIKYYVKSNNDNDFAHDLAGIISYKLGNKFDAFAHINKAIDINPTNDNYYFNLYYLNEEIENYDEALKNISSAIQLNGESPEYHYMRADLYFYKEYWKEAVSDYDVYIKSDRKISFNPYYKRAIAKLWIQDKTACQDLLHAYNLAENDEDKQRITTLYKRQKCKN